MPFHIRHGAPGSYKSACAVWLDCLSWLKQGRTVHTNIRGIGDAADFELAFGITLPDTARVVAYDLRTHNDRMMFAGWFHWLPIGDAIVIDEGQTIYPDRREFKPEMLDLPDDQNPVDPETGHHERPSDIFTAIDMHRHYNWDGCVTTPNIKKLPGWFRGSVERAYKHEDRSHIPLMKGKTRIISHSPETLSPTITKGVPVQTLKVPVNVFKVYGSTTTGEITNNISKKNPLRSPAVYLPFSIAALGLAWTIWGAVSLADNDAVQGASVAVPSSAAQAARAAAVRGDQQVVVHDAPVDASAAAYGVLADYLPGAKGVYIVGQYGVSGGPMHYLYSLVQGSGSVTVSGGWLRDAGFDIAVNGPCAHDLSHAGSPATLRVLCRPIPSRERSEAERASGEGLGVLSSVSPI